MTTTAPAKITARQREILDWITAYIASHGYSPSMREIGDAFGFKSTNGAVCHLEPLRKKGFVTWQDKQARTLRVTEVQA